MSVRRNDLSMLASMPMQPAWLLGLPAYLADDARLVRGVVHMLTAAFHGQPAGSLPYTVESVAAAARIDTALAKEHFHLLTQGWHVNRNKTLLTFEPLARLAERLHEGYAAALQRLQDGVMVAINAPDLFNSELLPDQGAVLAEKIGGETANAAGVLSPEARSIHSRSDAPESDTFKSTNVKRRLPQGVQLTRVLCEHLLKQGFARETHDEIWHSFADFHHSRQTLSADWNSEFRNWLRNQIHFGRLTPQAELSAGGNATSVALPVPRPAFRFSSPAGFGASSTTSQKDAIEATTNEKMRRAQQAVQVLRSHRPA